MHNSRFLLATSAAALMLLAGCGGADDASGTANGDTAAASENTQSTADDTADAENSSETMQNDSGNTGNTGNASDAGSQTEAYNQFLNSYVTEQNGIHLVAYGNVSDADHQALKDYIAFLETKNPGSMGRNEELAFWFNLYNAKTLDVILDNYPVDSIKDINGGPWDEKIMTVNGRQMSLDDIEHETVREKYDEPRIHYAFNCASIGCPNLKMTAWEASTLDADLNAAARAYLSHPRGVSAQDGDIDASSIFDWYQEDFGGSEEGVLNHIAQYTSGEKKSAVQSADNIDDYDYDWSLNDAS